MQHDQNPAPGVREALDALVQAAAPFVGPDQVTFPAGRRRLQDAHVAACDVLAEIDRSPSPPDSGERARRWLLGGDESYGPDPECAPTCVNEIRAGPTLQPGEEVWATEAGPDAVELLRGARRFADRADVLRVLSGTGSMAEIVERADRVLDAVAVFIEGASAPSPDSGEREALTADEARRVLTALIFGDPAAESQADPKLEVAKEKLRRVASSSPPAGGEGDDERESDLAKAVRVALGAGLWSDQIRWVVERELPRDLMAALEASLAPSTGEGERAREVIEWQVLGIDVDDAGDERWSPEVLIDPTTERAAAVDAARIANAQEVKQGNPPYYRVVLQRRSRTVTNWVDVPDEEGDGDGR